MMISYDPYTQQRRLLSKQKNYFPTKPQIPISINVKLLQSHRLRHRQCLTMINSNKNYSFIAITKQHIHKKNQINSSNHSIFTPNRTSHPLKKTQDALNLSYVSPNTQELSNFKSKLYKYIHHSTSHHDSKKELAQTKSKIDERLEFRSTKQLAKHFYKITSKSFYEGMEKRKNIRQYMCQLSQDKRKRYGNKVQNKSVELNSHLVQEEKTKINPMLIIRKVSNRIKETRDLKEKDIFKGRDVPIHHTQIYYFSKKNPKTEPEETSQERLDRYNSLDEERVPITMSRIIELREQLANRYENLKARAENNDESMFNPTVAIIETQQDLPINLRERDFQSQKKAKEEQSRASQTAKKKQQQEISPWNRRQQAQFQYD